MNLKRVRSFLPYTLTLTLPLLTGCNAPIDESNDSADSNETNVGFSAQAINIGRTNTIAGAHSASLVLKSDGTVWSFGGNAYGQLGDGTTTQRLTPVQVSGLSGVATVGQGAYYSIALKSDGTLSTW